MKRVVLVHAPWCGACQPMKAWWFKQEHGAVSFEMMEADDPSLADQGICSLPTLLFIAENGTVVMKHTGARNEAHVKQALEAIEW